MNPNQDAREPILHLSRDVMETSERLHAVDRTAARIFDDLPKTVAAHLTKVFRSEKPLAIALRAIVGESDPAALGMEYKIPTTWVRRYQETCLRAMRRKEVDLLGERRSKAGSGGK